MKKIAWKKKITEACKSSGTYEPQFDSVIETLAQILEKRDAAEEVYKQSGSHPIITHVNKAHEKNIVKNPALVVWKELNDSALAYWRDLGLTPAGLRKINDSALSGKHKDKLSEALAELGQELS